IPTLDANRHEDLYAVMKITFQNVWLVVLYTLAMISLGYHLLHGFSSAFQTMGWNHKKYTPIIKCIGLWFSILIPLLFAIMPIAMYFNCLK
ncbi:MAG: succinate dehydrogenase, partial [Chitinophagaceae bacterium]|nr:succinate dehydrogenase [Chitinophagaceae bacterium]